MKKKFWAIPVALAAVLCVVVLSACGGPALEDHIRADISESLSSISPESEGFMQALTADTENFEMLGIDPTDFATAYLDGYSYEIGDVTVDDDAGEATVDVTVNIKSLDGVLADYIDRVQQWSADSPDEPGDEETVYLKCGELLMDALNEAEPKESNVTFTYKDNGNGEWTLTEDAGSVLLDAMK